MRSCVDLCAWGRSKCQPRLAGEPAGQVRLAVDWARAQGAASVTLVGASLGGVTALAVGQEAGADAIVDLSGPFSYAGLDSADVAAPRITVPLLVAMAPSDAQMEPAKVKEAFEDGAGERSSATSSRPTATAGGCSTTAPTPTPSGRRWQRPCSGG